MNSFRSLGLVLAILIIFSCCEEKPTTLSDLDWVSYQHDNQNSGISSISLSFPLSVNWVDIKRNAPSPAWPAPAKQDYYNKVRKLEALVTYDRVFHTTIANGLLYYASSTTNQVYCLDANSGEKLWSFFTDAPNRTVPTINKGKLYFGSDDGYIYCLNAKKGKLLWKYKPGKSNLKIIGNGKIVAASPNRTGVLVKGDTLYATAGLLPEQEVHVMALDANNGEVIWEHKQDGLAPQGYPIASNDKLYVPNSRAQPYAFDLKTGDFESKLKGKGGDYITLAKTKVIHGVNHNGEIKSKDFLAAAFSGHKVIVGENKYFVAADFELTSIEKEQYEKVVKERDSLGVQLSQITEEIRGQKKDSKNVSNLLNTLSQLKGKIDALKNKEFLWQAALDKPISIIKTANAIIVGEDGKLSAFNVTDGSKVWEHDVEGKPYGLSVAQGNLYVSTDNGNIYCFSSGQKIKQKKIKHKINADYFVKSSEKELYQQTAELVLEQSKRKKGICLVLGCNEGRLAYEIAQQSDFYVIGIEEDAGKVARARKELDKSGLYGNRITIFEGVLKDLNFTKYIANLIVDDRFVSTGEFNESSKAIYRVLQPNGGKLILASDRIIKKETFEENLSREQFMHCQWQITDGKVLTVTRSKLPNTGEWTHLYGNAANTVSSGDKKVNENITPQWFGQPGPREMTDRHHRAVSPLYKNGILFIPKDNGVIAADAYNGTLLWNKHIQNFRRIKIARDAGSLAVGDKYFYAVADNACNVIEPITGKEMPQFKVPQLFNVDKDWGYIAVIDDQLFGSARKPEAIYNQYNRFDWGEHGRLVCSDYLFSMNSDNGKLQWTYKEGMILNSSITIGNGKMYFVESRNSVSMNDDDGLIGLKEFIKGKPYIVALDIKTGKKLWERTFKFNLLGHTLFGSYDKGILLLSGSGNKNKGLWYGTYAFNADDGVLKWKQEMEHAKWINGSHGEQHHRALIMEDKVYVEPYAFDLQTGEKVDDWELARNGHSCGNISGSAGQLFFRGSNPSLVDVNKTDQGSKINSTTRTGCWINIIPAGGLVMIPEASSGCSCDYPLQMSVTYLPEQ